MTTAAAAPAPGGAPTWLIVLGMVLTLLGAGGGISSVLLVRRQSSKLKVDSAEVLSRTSLALVGPLEHRLSETNVELDKVVKQAAEAKATAAAATTALARVEQEADGLREETRLLRLIIQRWRRAIMDPSASVDQLRELVGGDTIV